MCDAVFDVDLYTAAAMNTAILATGWIPVFLSVLFLRTAVRAAFPRPEAGAARPPRREWAMVVTLTLMRIMNLFLSVLNIFFETYHFRLAGPDIRAAEVAVMRYVPGDWDQQVRSVTIADPADVCHLLGLVRAAPVGSWQGAVGVGADGDEYYKVRFRQADGTLSECGLDVLRHGRRKRDIHVTLLMVELRHVGALHSPALTEWPADKIANR